MPDKTEEQFYKEHFFQALEKRFDKIDYELKDISISQINQLSKYLEDYNCDIGFLICYKKPKRDNFLIGKNKIFILEETELSKIPELIKGASDNGSSPSGSRKLSEDTAKRGFDSLRPH